MIVWMISLRFFITKGYPMYVSSSYFIGSFRRFMEWLTTATISMHFFLML